MVSKLRAHPAAQSWHLPPPVQPGAIVRVVAPSGVVDPQALQAGLRCLVRLGLQPLLGDHVLTRHLYCAGTAVARQSDLCTALADRQASVIWAARGGYGAAQTVDKLDPQHFMTNAWLIGFSDITVLHCCCSLAHRCSLHGPNIESLPRLTAAAWQRLKAWLFEQPVAKAACCYDRVKTPPQRLRIRGRLWGGNLTVLSSLVGSRWLQPPKHAIWLLEDVHEAPYRLDRAIHQLRSAGCLKHLAAVVVGKLVHCQADPAARSQTAAITAIRAALAPLAIPVAEQLAVGHFHGNLAVPLGCMAELDCEAGLLRIDI